MKRASAIVFVSGFAAVIAQTVILREALALFGGNELVSGILLCFWLIWGGIGSIIFSSFRLKAEPEKVYALLLVFVFVLQVFSLCFIRIAPRIFNLPVGEVIDLRVRYHREGYLAFAELQRRKYLWLKYLASLVAVVWVLWVFFQDYRLSPRKYAIFISRGGAREK